MSGLICNVYSRPDGVVGVGFEIQWAGKPQHSVSWPDRPSFRYTDQGLERAGISVEYGEGLAPVTEPAEASEPEAVATPEPTPVVTEPTPVVTETAEEATAEAEEATAETETSEAQSIRDYLAANPEAANKDVITALAEQGIQIQSSQVTRERKKLAA